MANDPNVQQWLDYFNQQMNKKYYTTDPNFAKKFNAQYNPPQATPTQPVKTDTSNQHSLWDTIKSDAGNVWNTIKQDMSGGTINDYNYAQKVGSTQPLTGGDKVRSDLGHSLIAGVGDITKGVGDTMRWISQHGPANEIKDVAKKKGLISDTTSPLEQAGTSLSNWSQQNIIKPNDVQYGKPFSAQSMLDPDWYATSVARSVPFTVAAAFTGIPGAKIGSKVLGGVAEKLGAGATVQNIARVAGGGLGASAVNTPFESAQEAAQTYDQAIKDGHDKQTASNMADKVFKNNMLLLGATETPEFAMMFAPFIKKVPGASTVEQSLIKSISRGAMKVGASAALEGGQEAGQQVIQDNAQGHSLDWNAMYESGVIGALMGGVSTAGTHIAEGLQHNSHNQSNPTNPAQPSQPTDILDHLQQTFGSNGNVMDTIHNNVRQQMSDQLKNETSDVQDQLEASGKYTPEEVQSHLNDFIASTDEGKQLYSDEMARQQNRITGQSTQPNQQQTSTNQQTQQTQTQQPAQQPQGQQPEAQPITDTLEPPVQTQAQPGSPEDLQAKLNQIQQGVGQQNQQANQASSAADQLQQQVLNNVQQAQQPQVQPTQEPAQPTPQPNAQEPVQQPKVDANQAIPQGQVDQLAQDEHVEQPQTFAKGDRVRQTSSGAEGVYDGEPLKHNTKLHKVTLDNGKVQYWSPAKMKKVEGTQTSSKTEMPSEQPKAQTKVSWNENVPAKFADTATIHSGHEYEVNHSMHPKHPNIRKHETKVNLKFDDNNDLYHYNIENNPFEMNGRLKNGSMSSAVNHVISKEELKKGLEQNIRDLVPNKKEIIDHALQTVDEKKKEALPTKEENPFKVGDQVYWGGEEGKKDNWKATVTKVINGRRLEVKKDNGELLERPVHDLTKIEGNSKTEQPTEQPKVDTPSSNMPTAKDVADALNQYKHPSDKTVYNEQSKSIPTIQDAVSLFHQGKMDELLQKHQSLLHAGNNPHYAKPFEHFTGVKLPWEASKKAQKEALKKHLEAIHKNKQVQTKEEPKTEQPQEKDVTDLIGWLDRNANKDDLRHDESNTRSNILNLVEYLLQKESNYLVSRGWLYNQKRFLNAFVDLTGADPSLLGAKDHQPLPKDAPKYFDYSDANKEKFVEDGINGFWSQLGETRDEQIKSLEKMASIFNEKAAKERSKYYKEDHFDLANGQRGQDVKDYTAAYNKLNEHQKGNLAARWNGYYFEYQNIMDAIHNLENGKSVTPTRNQGGYKVKDEPPVGEKPKQETQDLSKQELESLKENNAKPLGVIDESVTLPKVAYKESKTQITATFTPISRFGSKESTTTWNFPKGKTKQKDGTFKYSEYLLLPKGVSVADVNSMMGIEFYQEGVTAPELIATFKMMNGETVQSVEKPSKPEAKKTETTTIDNSLAKAQEMLDKAKSINNQDSINFWQREVEKRTPKQESKAPSTNTTSNNPEPTNVKAEAPNKYDKAHAELKWLDDLADRAEDYWNKNKNRSNALPLDLFAAGVIMGARKMAHGVIDFAQWSEEMIKSYGEDIRLSLKGLYAQSDAFLNDFSHDDRMTYLEQYGVQQLAEGLKNPNEMANEQQTEQDHKPTSEEKLTFKDMYEKVMLNGRTATYKMKLWNEAKAYAEAHNIPLGEQYQRLEERLTREFEREQQEKEAKKQNPEPKQPSAKQEEQQIQKIKDDITQEIQRQKNISTVAEATDEFKRRVPNDKIVKSEIEKYVEEKLSPKDIYEKVTRHLGSIAMDVHDLLAANSQEEADTFVEVMKNTKIMKEAFDKVYNQVSKTNEPKANDQGYWMEKPQQRSDKNFHFKPDEQKIYSLLPEAAKPAFLKGILGKIDPRLAYDVYIKNNFANKGIQFDSKVFQELYNNHAPLDLKEARREYLGYGLGLDQSGTMFQVTMDRNGKISVVYEPNSPKNPRTMSYGELQDKVNKDEVSFGKQNRPVWLDDPTEFIQNLRKLEGENNVSNPNNTGSVSQGETTGSVPGNETKGDTPTVSSPNNGESENGTGQSGERLVDEPTDGNGLSGESTGHPETVPDSPRTPDGRPIQVDHTIRENIYESGKVTRFNNNIAALKLLKQLKQEDRYATTDEQQILAKYQGWGGLPEYFNEKKDEFKKLQQYMGDLFTKEEYDDMERSTTTSFYTNYEVADKMYQILKDAGFTGGRILEPSVGTGMMIGAMPDDLKANSHFLTVEKDRISYEITKYLYPNQAHFNMPFQNKSLAENSFDVVIGNVPFGTFGVSDTNYRKQTKNGKKIDMSWATSLVHNYFLVRSMDLLRPGGIGVLITTTNTLDGKDSSKETRKYLEENADVLEVLRLPNEAFKDAGTSVASDIIFFRKKVDPESHALDNISTVVQYAGRHLKWDEEAGKLNQYFVKNPDHVAGEIETTTDRYGKADLYYRATDFAKKFAKGIKSITAKFRDKFVPDVKTDDALFTIENAIEEAWAQEEKGLYDGAVHIKDGKFVQWTYGNWVPFQVKDEHKTMVQKAIGVRDAAMELEKLERDKNNKTESLMHNRQKLNRLYDAFVAQHGNFNKKGVLQPLANDVRAVTALKALETYNEKTKSWDKIELFEKRMKFPDVKVDVKGDIKQAISVSLAHRGFLDIGLISNLMHKSFDDTVKELEDKNLVYYDPEQTEHVTADEYLSGNIRHKLQFVQGRPEFMKQEEALKNILPTELTSDQVIEGVRFGQQWIPNHVYQNFLRDKLNIMEPEVKYDKNTASWTVKSTSKHWNATGSHENVNTYGLQDDLLHQKWDGMKIIQTLMNQKSLKASINEDKIASYQKKDVEQERLTTLLRRKGEQLLTEFKSYIASNPQLNDQTTKLYNAKFNSYVLRAYNGEEVYGNQEKGEVPVPGLNPKYTLMKHQKDAVVRTLRQQNTLYAHVVGAGKTLEIQASIMEGRRLGIIRKPMLVVPSFMLEQHAREFQDAYPNAKIKVLGTGTGENDIASVKVSGVNKLEEAKAKSVKEQNRMKRYKSLADVMYGDHDVVIMTYEGFERIPVSPEFEEQFLRGEIEKLRTALQNFEGKDYTTKEIQNAIERLEKRILDSKNTDIKDVAISFEELGIDALFVDEAHNFKNLMYFSKMGNIAGLSNSDAKRSLDMYMKTTYLNNTGSKTIFATGTPIANSVAEMFTMLRYLAPKKLAEYDMEHFDGWAAQFGNTVNSVELNTSGKFIERTRFSEFVNVPELMNMFKDVADVKMAEDLTYLKRPEVERQTITSPMSDKQKTYLELMVKRAEEMPDDPAKDNMLKLTGEGKKLALDYRIIDGTAPNEIESKLNTMAEEVANEYFATEKGNVAAEGTTDEKGNKIKTFDKGTQIVFMDLGVPKADDKKSEDGISEDTEDAGSNSMYQNLKDRLVQLGVKANEIAFIHDYSKPDQKKALSERFNKGEIRVLIGSTGKMGVGMNLQTRLTALHHADPTWRPADIEQREGRIVRQGNWNSKVKVKTYVTEGSFDALMWNTLETKAKFIAQVMSGDTKVRTLDEIAELIMSYSEIKASATNNEAMKKLLTTEKELRALRDLEQEHAKQQAQYANRLASLPGKIDNDKKTLVTLDEAKTAAKDIDGDNFTGMVDGVTYSEADQIKKRDENKKNKVKDEVPSARKLFREAMVRKINALQSEWINNPPEVGDNIPLAKLGGLDLQIDIEDGKWSSSNARIYLQYTGSNGKTIYVANAQINDALQNEGQNFMTRAANGVRRLVEGQYKSSTEQTIKNDEKALKEAREKGNQPFPDGAKLNKMLQDVAELRDEARQYELTNSFDTVFQNGKDLYVVTGIGYEAVVSKNKKKKSENKPDYVIRVQAQKIEEQKEYKYNDEHDQPHTVNVFRMGSTVDMRDVDFIRDYSRREDVVGISEATYRNRLDEIKRVKDQIRAEQEQAANLQDAGLGMDGVALGQGDSVEYWSPGSTQNETGTVESQSGDVVTIKRPNGEKIHLSAGQVTKKAQPTSQSTEPVQTELTQTQTGRNGPNEAPHSRRIKGWNNATVAKENGKWTVKTSVSGADWGKFAKFMQDNGGTYHKKGDPVEAFRSKFTFDTYPEKILVAENIGGPRGFSAGADTMEHSISPKTAKAVTHQLAKALDTVIRPGNVEVRGAAASFNSSKYAGNIKNKWLHNIRISAHELGHAFENYGFEGNTDELLHVGETYYPAWDKINKQADRISEGRAELFTLYLLDPETAKAMAPESVQEIEDIIANHAKLQKVFDGIHETIAAEKNKGAFERGIGSIKMPSEKRVSANIGDEYALDNVPEGATKREEILAKTKGTMKRIITSAIDFKVPWKDLQKELDSTDYSGKNLVKMLAVTGNSEMNARASFSNWATDHLGRYIINYQSRDEVPDHLGGILGALTEQDPRSITGAQKKHEMYQRYASYYKEGIDEGLSHDDAKEKAILQAISSRSLEEIATDGITYIAGRVASGELPENVMEQFKRLKDDKSKKETPEFQVFTGIIQAYRAKERYGREDAEGNKKFSEVYMSEEDANANVELSQQSFPDLENLIREYTDNLSNIIFTKLVNAGVETQETRDTVEQGSDWYIPTYYATKNPYSSSQEEADRKTARKVINAFRGRQAIAINFVDASAYKLLEVEQSIEFKRVLDEVENAMRTEEMGLFGEILKPNVVQQMIDGGHIAKQVADAVSSILGDDVVIDPKHLEDNLAQQVFNRFFPADMMKQPILMNWHGKKRVYIRLAPDLYNSLRSMKPIQVGPALRMLSKLSSWTRYVQIITPRFIMNQLSRDFFTGTMQHNLKGNAMTGSANFARSWVKGLFLAAGKDEKMADAYMNSGAFMSAHENVINDFKRSNLSDGLIKTKVKGWKKTKAGRFVHVFSPTNILQWQEQISRYGVWQQKAKELAADYGIDPKKIFDGREPLTASEQKIMEKILLDLGYEASEVTTNFRTHGSSEEIRKRIQPISFLHGSLQGLYREAQEMKKNPKRVFMRGVMTILPMTILAWAAMQALNPDDKDDITSDMRDKYWIFPMGNHYFFVAKPFSYTILTDYLERAMDEAFGQAGARKWYEDFMGPLVQNFTVPFLPIWGQTIVDLYANKTYYGAPIVNPNEKSKFEEISSKSSALSEWQAYAELYTLGKVYGAMGKNPEDAVISPAKFDYAMKSLLGVPGQAGSAVVDNLAGKDRNVFNSMQTNYVDKSTTASRFNNMFYDKNNAAEAEYKRQVDAGQVEKGKPTDKVKAYRQMAKDLADMRKVKEDIASRKELTSSQKAEATRKVNNAMHDVSRYGNGVKVTDPDNLNTVLGWVEQYRAANK